MRSIIGSLVLCAFASAALAQGTKLPNKDSLYNGNRLKVDPTPGGPAPARDLSGSWAGNLTPDRGAIPPLTPLGQKLFALNKPETEVGTGHSNDPMNTCDPLGLPRNTVFETRGLAFGTMGPDKLVVLHQYQRIWRYVWMDGKHELPTKFDAPGGVPSRYYGYSVGHWENDNTLVITASTPRSRSATRAPITTICRWSLPWTTRRSLPSRSSSPRTTTAGFRTRKPRNRCASPRK